MQPKTEEFLNLLLWSADTLARPTFRNFTDSYESWAYRNGLMRQVATLEKRRFLERGNSSLNDRLYRLTAAGRLHVLGGRDPEERWRRDWDGQWRMVLFDVPTGQNAQRERLRRYLRAKAFGYRTLKLLPARGTSSASTGAMPDTSKFSRSIRSLHCGTSGRQKRCCAGQRQSARRGCTR